MDFFQYSYIIPIVPFVCFFLLGLSAKKIPDTLAGYIGTLGIVVSLVFSYLIAYQYFISGDHGGFNESIEWLRFTDTLAINLGIKLDSISVMMLVVITTISFMVHVFSMGYMKGEKGYGRYYAYLSLFTFSMLSLVLATNILQMYIFWELVGVSSFLLIGFYFDKPSAVAASKKAFIVTRFADLGFLVGILLLSFHTGSLDFDTIIQVLTTESAQYTSMTTTFFMGGSLITWALLLIFIGGAGKSAMFPLHIWLPDAMEGPTPVSALIHAATMVVAGVYLVARLFPVFSFAAPEALSIIAWVGAITALFAAIIACTQTDIKRVLAFSTISQIAYMITSLGVSGFGGEDGLGYMASLFHLFTHAMFKALLFLGAGTVIHYVHSNEMSKMGGLRKAMPITHITFLIACLAIAGFPGFSGFFSKEEILTAAYQNSKPIYAILLFTAGLTAFYMFRLYLGIFWWKKPSEAPSNLHGEGSMTMLLPLLFLGIASLFAGFIPFSKLVTSDGVAFETHMHLNLAAAAVGSGLLGIIIAFYFFRSASDRPARFASSLGGFYRVAKQKFYVDEFYLFMTHAVVFSSIARPYYWIERKIVDGGLDGLAYLTQKISLAIRGFQSGQLQQYVVYFILGVLVSLVYFLDIWKQS